MGGGEDVGVCVFEDGDDGLFEGSAFAVAVLPGVDWFDLAGLDLVVDDANDVNVNDAVFLDAQIFINQ